jgi:tetratricopeptide (TPR) repeat protein
MESHPANSALSSAFSPALSQEERQEKRRLILRDSFSLAGLFVITIVLSVVTWFFFRSFEDHRDALAHRWLTRGQYEMQHGHPEPAIYALRSALAYSPGDRDLEIQLATALAVGGHTQEAVSYFSTLRESAPGDGMINLQLARLAAKPPAAESGRAGPGRVSPDRTAETIRYYQEALDGTWQGDGYTRRREVRLELSRYLIAQQDFNRARSQLLIAAGNSLDDPAVKLEIAALFEQAHAPQDALDLYRTAAQKKPASLAALEGAGRTAYELNHYPLAWQYLERAVNHPDFKDRPATETAANRDMLGTAERLVALSPEPGLSVRTRAERVMNAEKIAAVRMAGCTAKMQAPTPELANLTARWGKLPTPLKVLTLEQQPELEESVMQLVFDTERVTATICGAPTGDDALLLRLARIPVTTESAAEEQEQP